jgi:exonuclease SbcD
MPFEVLLVRRCKKARQRRQAQLSQQDNSMLSELSLAEVFDSRLSQLDWQTDEEVSRKTRLKQLFTEISVELVSQQKSVNLPAEKNTEILKIKEADQGVKTDEVGQENL